MSYFATTTLILFVLFAGLVGYYYLDDVVPMQKLIQELERQNEELHLKLAQAQDRSDDLNRELEESVRAIAKEKNTEIEHIKRTYEELLSGLEEQISRGEITITRLADQLNVNIVDKILFPSGEAELTEQGRGLLTRVGKILLQAKSKRIKVEGHTDNIPIHAKLQSRFETNWELSVLRATHVVRFLEELIGLQPGNLEAAGFGQYRPIASNNTRQGRALNRRIEILLLPAIRN
jgi:chemotaxis protein MotB